MLFQARFSSDAGKYKGLTNANYWRMLFCQLGEHSLGRAAEYARVNFYMQLLHDREVAAAGRLEQTLSMGLTCKFI